MTTVEVLRRRLEVQRLAAELGADESALRGLDVLPADEVAHLRRALAAGLVARHAPVFDAFARAADMVPAAVAARITRRVIGPALAGRMAGSMSGSRAAAIMSHLDVSFLADACRTLSAEAAASLVPAIDDDQIRATTAELARRGDHATLGRFVDVVDDRRLRLVLDTLRDPADLLVAGAAVDRGAALDRVVGLLSPGRRLDVVAATSAQPDAAASVLVRAAPATRALLLEAVASLDDDGVVRLLDDLAAAARGSAALRAAAGGLPGPELAHAARVLDRSPDVRSAVGRLTMAVLDQEGRR